MFHVKSHSHNCIVDQRHRVRMSVAKVERNLNKRVFNRSVSLHHLFAFFYFFFFFSSRNVCLTCRSIEPPYQITRWYFHWQVYFEQKPYTNPHQNEQPKQWNALYLSLSFPYWWQFDAAILLSSQFNKFDVEQSVSEKLLDIFSILHKTIVEISNMRKSQSIPRWVFSPSVSHSIKRNFLLFLNVSFVF